MRDDDLPLAERIERALARIKNGEAPMRCPVEATDPDVVLADCAAEIAKLQEAVRAIVPERCWDCEGAGDLGRAGESALARLVACESCGGHEDRRGAGYIENQDVDYAEWMERPEVRRAIDAKAQAEPVGVPSAVRFRLMRAASVIEALEEEETPGGAR